MQPNEIKNAFDAVFNGQGNFMTPDPIKYGKKGNYLYELSKGDFMGKTMYGVTVITTEGEKTELSAGGFETLEQCKTFIKDL